MFKNGIFALICVLAVLPLGASASSGLPALDSLIALSLARNPDLQAAEHRRQAAYEEADRAGSLPDPQVSLGYMNLPRTSLAMGETPMSSVALGLTQQIPWPGKLSLKSDLAGLTAESKALDRQARENQLVRLVTEQYYELAYWEESSEILAENGTLLDAIAEISRTRYANGEASAQDVLRSQTARARLDNRLLMTESRRASALNSLGWLIDDPSIAGSPPAVRMDGITMGSEPPVVSNPTLTRAAVQTSVANRRVALARKDYWPDLTFGIDYMARSETAMDPVGGEDFLSFKVGLRLPLWNLGHHKHEVAAARWNLAAARADEQALVTKLNQRALDIRQTILSTADRVRQYDDEILPDAEAASEAARVAYEVGQVDFDAVLMSLLDFMNARMERLELLKQYHQQAAVLAELTAGTKEIVR